MSFKGQYTHVNLMKFISAFLVIAIHTHPLFDLSWGGNFFLVNVLARIAVPFYLVTSGFFLYSKIMNQTDSSSCQKIKQYVHKLFYLYIWWSLFYLVINIPAYFLNKTFIVGVAHVIRNFLFTSIDVHLWYLLASGIAVLCIAYVIRKSSWKVLMILSVGLYVLLLLTQTYSSLISQSMIGTFIGLYEQIFGTIANSFMMAIPFLTFGMAIHHYELIKKLKHAGKWSIITFILMCIEHFVMRLIGPATDYAVSLSVGIFIIVFFIYLVQKDEQKQPPLLVKYSNLFQQVSLFIYLIHIAFLRLLLVIYNAMGIENPRLVTFILISILSLGSYLCLKKIQLFYLNMVKIWFKRVEGETN